MLDINLADPEITMIDLSEGPVSCAPEPDCADAWAPRLGPHAH